MPDEILTLAEVTLLLKVAEKTVYTMARRGELPAFKISRTMALPPRRVSIVTGARRKKSHADGSSLFQ